MFFFVWFLIPETKGISLEKMDELFGTAEPGKLSHLDDPERGEEKATAETKEVK